MTTYRSWCLLVSRVACCNSAGALFARGRRCRACARGWFPLCALCWRGGAGQAGVWFAGTPSDHTRAVDSTSNRPPPRADCCIATLPRAQAALLLAPAAAFAASAPPPWVSAKGGCAAVPLAKCGTDFSNNCLYCGDKSDYDCEKCCPGKWRGPLTATARPPPAAVCQIGAGLHRGWRRGLGKRAARKAALNVVDFEPVECTVLGLSRLVGRERPHGRPPPGPSPGCTRRAAVALPTHCACSGGAAWSPCSHGAAKPARKGGRPASTLSLCTRCCRATGPPCLRRLLHCDKGRLLVLRLQGPQAPAWSARPAAYTIGRERHVGNVRDSLPPPPPTAATTTRAHTPHVRWGDASRFCALHRCSVAPQPTTSATHRRAPLPGKAEGVKAQRGAFCKAHTPRTLPSSPCRARANLTPRRPPLTTAAVAAVAPYLTFNARYTVAGMDVISVTGGKVAENYQKVC